LAILLKKPFGPEEFEAFIQERQKTIQEAILNLLIKERLDLAPHLRELDATIEGIELRLRELVDEALNRDPGLVPGHIAQKVDERAGRTRKKSAVFDADRYNTLAGRLEYFDLREIQELIQNKALWSKFAPRFANQDALSGKFNQLAELRNGIRHSRSVDDITRKEGEAAILWFEQVLR
jgi:5'-deoxynucleotidase YfbR-like HD superfamily hydrolase